MSRIIKKIEIQGKRATALFDTGALFSYVRKTLVSNVPKHRLREPYRVGLGGTAVDVREMCFVSGAIDGQGIDFDAAPVDNPGRADGHRIDVIVGALTMERWDIRLHPRKGTVEVARPRGGVHMEF